MLWKGLPARGIQEDVPWTYDWGKEVLEYDGDVVIVCPQRQTIYQKLDLSFQKRHHAGSKGIFTHSLVKLTHTNFHDVFNGSKVTWF